MYKIISFAPIVSGGKGLPCMIMFFHEFRNTKLYSITVLYSGKSTLDITHQQRGPVVAILYTGDQV